MPTIESDRAWFTKTQRSLQDRLNELKKEPHLESNSTKMPKKSPARLDVDAKNWYEVTRERLKRMLEIARKENQENR